MCTFPARLFALGAALLFGASAYAGGEVATSFDPSDFNSDSANVDNKYWPQPPDITYSYRSVATDGCEVNDVEATDTTPTIDGVVTREVHDQVWEDDTCSGSKDFLSEDTLDRYAQDVHGNIWYFGESTKSYCDREHPDMVCDTIGSWTAGVDGAAPGIVMLAHPAPGDFYRQEYAEDASDMAKVLRLNAKVQLGFDNNIDPDSYNGCLETKEWSPLEAGAIEHKFYCDGKGLVLIEELQGGTVRTELVDVQ